VIANQWCLPSADVHRRSLASAAFGSIAIFSKNWVVRYRIKLFGPAFTFVWQGLQHSDSPQ
jgi:hypothetical protein